MLTFISLNNAFSKYESNILIGLLLFQKAQVFYAVKIICNLTLTLESLGGVGFHRKFRNIAIGHFNALKSWPYTSKFTYDHPEQIETIFKSIGGFGKFWGAVERVRSKNPEFVRFQIF